MVKGETTIDGNTYNFQENGSLFKGWGKDGKYYIYADPQTGAYAEGLTEIKVKT